MDEIRASIAMAVYNGEKYLREQIDSILAMMAQNDELVISYDKSNDDTLDIVKEYVSKDKRIHCFANECKAGVSGNFTNAAKHCRGKYVFFSDQDDYWYGDKISKVVGLFQKSKADLVIHDGFLGDVDLKKSEKTLFQINKASVNPIKNFYKGRFLGCCMAFNKEALNYILPFPDITNDFPHDIFATILVGIKGKIELIDECFIIHRIHENNATPHSRNSVLKVIKGRAILGREIVKRMMVNASKK